MRTPDRKDCVENFDQNFCVLAGAGSGKTTLLVQRFLHAITHRAMGPDQILAITFTDKAANEMKQRLVQECLKRGLVFQRRALEGAYIGTIHSFCARLLRENPIESGLDPFFRILGEGEADAIMDRVLDSLFDQERHAPSWISFLVAQGESAARKILKDCYEMSRSSVDVSVDEMLRRAGSPEGRLLARVFERFRADYDHEKRSSGVYDFQDLLYKAYRLLSGTGLAQRAVRARYQERFLAILVDEVQDTSLLQFRLVELLRRGTNLFLVGDNQQSIYGFRYAEPAVLQTFIEKIPEIRTIALVENFRSRPEILSFVNAFFSRVSPDNFRPLLAAKKFKNKAHPSVECLPIWRRDQEDLDQARIREAHALALRIKRMIQEGLFRPQDIVILFRSASHVYLHEKELSDCGISYSVNRGRGFYDKIEIQDLVNFLKVMQDPQEDIPLAACLRSPWVGVSDDGLFWLARRAKQHNATRPLEEAFGEFDAIEELSQEDRGTIAAFLDLLNECRQLKDRIRPTELVHRLLERTRATEKVLAQNQGVQALANLTKLVGILEALEFKGLKGLDSFVEYIQGLSDRDVSEPEARAEAGEEDRVTLSTIHSAKGLEFPCVFLADLGSGVPSQNRNRFLMHPQIGFGVKPDETYARILHSLEDRDRTESERLLYVAMTRAQEHLVLSGVVQESSWMGRVVSALELHTESTEAHFGGAPIRVG